MDSRCVYFCILAGAALMTVGLSGCGGGIQEGIEPDVDMTKAYPTPAKADMSGQGRPPKVKKYNKPDAPAE